MLAYCLLVSGCLFVSGTVVRAGQRVAQQARPLAVYIIDPVTGQKILPDTPPRLFPVLAPATGDEMKVSACRGQFEAASIVLRPIQDITDVTIEISDLKGPNGSVISRKEVDVRVVKCWYQGGTTVARGQTLLVPELLLKDDSLVQVDNAARKNYLRVTIGGEARYIDINSPNQVFPKNAAIHDSHHLLPFNVTANANKQLWFTFHVPADAASGDYQGSIVLKSRAAKLSTINVKLTVLPFDLETPWIDYALVYKGQLRKGEVTEIGSDLKSARQYAVELQDMKDHGVLYPTLTQKFDEMLGQALAMRRDIGLPTDRLYVEGIKIEDFLGVRLAALQGSIGRWKAFVSRYGYKDLYIYGKDEAEGEALSTQRFAWQLTHAAGAKVYATCSDDALDISGDLLDQPVLGGKFRTSTVKGWHKLGKKVYIYANPQVGVEDPEVYRRNYGIALACSGYDGEMNFAYQFAFHNIWNDFDDKAFRDHVFAYPTTDGVISTVEWEGFREGVDDVRYLTTLSKLAGASSYSPACGAIQGNADMRSVRQNVIDRILSDYVKGGSAAGMPQSGNPQKR
jgi:hypothetical protein